MATSRTGTTTYLRNRTTLLRKAQATGLTNCPGWTDPTGTHHPCGRELDYTHSGRDNSAEADHITPPKFGGTDDLDNLTVLCRHCNIDKGDGTRTRAPFADIEQFPTSRRW